MHGRLKIKTTAEQEAEKKKERLKKLQLYNAGIQKAQSKRTLQEFDTEALEITSQLLLANPDLYTMWNFRKEIILSWKQQKTVEELIGIKSSEISFTESCLRINPKSYGSWYHRLWILQEMPQPDWLRELQLCNRYLELDERNFHCWDYRFLIAKFCQVTAEEELKFSDLKISSNFSNYSSWHYRSKLLPKVYPDPEQRRTIKEDKLMQEFELVQNAAFTDPDDQSVWFYHQWLLGQGERRKLPRFIYSDRQNLILVFTGIISKSDFMKVTLTINDIEEKLDWQTPCGFQDGSPIWISKLDRRVGRLNFHVKMSLNEEKVFEIALVLEESEGERMASPVSAGNNYFNRIPLTDATTAVLQHELDSVNQLLELEPHSKWPLLTSVLLMSCLNFSNFKDKIFENLRKLMEVDPLRNGYYKDLRSKYIMENHCESVNAVEASLDLANLKLTKIYHSEYLFASKKINLSGNCLRTLTGINLFVCVEELNLDGNEITSCQGLEGLVHLTCLSLRNNKISTLESLQPLEHCPSLTQLDLLSNEVCDNHDYINYLKSLLPNLKVLNGNPL